MNWWNSNVTNTNNLPVTNYWDNLHCQFQSYICINKNVQQTRRVNTLISLVPICRSFPLVCFSVDVRMSLLIFSSFPIFSKERKKERKKRKKERKRERQREREQISNISLQAWMGFKNHFHVSFQDTKMHTHTHTHTRWTHESLSCVFSPTLPHQSPVTWRSHLHQLRGLFHNSVRFRQFTV